jgi:hypothetical protein
MLLHYSSKTFCLRDLRLFVLTLTVERLNCIVTLNARMVMVAWPDLRPATGAKVNSTVILIIWKIIILSLLRLRFLLWWLCFLPFAFLMCGPALRFNLSLELFLFHKNLCKLQDGVRDE